jgi:hypothetical protein
MTRASAVVLVVGLLAACKGKDTSPGAGTGTGSGSATGTADATDAAITDGAVAAAVAPDLRCETQCRFLANVPLADAPAFYQQACGGAWVTPAADDCDALDLQRNCIYATAGYVFKKEKWKTFFGKQPWYTARPDFKETDLSRVATANIRELKQDALTCRGADGEHPIPARLTASSISAADRKTIVAWFTKKAKGDIVLPPKLESDFQPTDEAGMLSWLRSPDLFVLKEWTPFEYREGKPGEPRTVMVATSAAPPDCVDDGNEGCEGFEVIYFDLDAAGKIVGIGVTAAACPLVYVEQPGGALDYQGEILRFLGRPTFESAQELPLAGATCAAGTVRVQLVEAKDEITYLDDVALIVDGIALAPRACTAAAPPAYCGDDGRRFTLARGDSLALAFDVPAGSACRRLALRADGHYATITR